MIKWELWIFGKKISEVRCHSHDGLSRVRTIDMVYHCGWCLDPLAEVVCDQFLHCQVTIPPIPTLSPLEGSHFVWPTLKEEELYSTIKYLEFLYMGDLSILPMCLLSQSLIYVSMESWIFTVYFEL